MNRYPRKTAFLIATTLMCGGCATTQVEDSTPAIPGSAHVCELGDVDNEAVGWYECFGIAGNTCKALGYRVTSREQYEVTAEDKEAEEAARDADAAAAQQGQLVFSDCDLNACYKRSTVREMSYICGDKP